MGPGRASPGPLQMEKRQLRQQMIAARQALPPAEREVLGRRAQQALVASSWFQRARVVMLYLPIRGEVETAGIAAAARAGGKRLVLPRVQREPRRLWLHLWVGEPESGAYGIPEPDASWPLVQPGEIDLVVVPGVAFDRLGNRLGYGAGYYDRTLPEIRSANPSARCVGLAYGLQVVERLPAAPHDVPLDGVATEDGLIVV